MADLEGKLIVKTIKCSLTNWKFFNQIKIDNNLQDVDSAIDIIREEYNARRKR